MTSSKMPDGGYEPMLGSNYMLDGFDFSEEYGEGVLTNRKDPDPDLPRSQSGLSHLPEGVLTEGPNKFAGDVTLNDSEEYNLGDISSMVREAAYLTDLSWLETAEQDPDRLPVSPKDSVIKGLPEAWGISRRTDGVNLVPNVVVPPQPKSETAHLPGDQFLGLIASAMRRSAFGESLDNIVQDVSTHLRSQDFDSPQGLKFASAIHSVRAEHGIVGQLYLRDSAFPGLLTGKWDSIIKKKCASAAYWLTKPGSKLAAYDNFLGKQVVTEIPWGTALELYRPRLEVSGRRLASGDPKKALLAALLSDVPSTRKSTYEGPGVGVKSPLPQATKDASWAKTQEDLLRQASVDKARGVVASLVKAGKLSSEDADKLLSSGIPPKEMVHLAHDRIVNHIEIPQYVAAKDYTGPVFKARVTATKAAAQVEVLDRASQQVVKYASIQMNEGVAGDDLDVMLRSRFAKSELEAASGQLVQIRKKHEGLAGHLYVDASVYASTTGTAGCEKGALIHRANQLKSLLKMARCESCSCNVSGKCQKYAKTLVSETPAENPGAYQKEAIRLANADDSERTAAMFARGYEDDFDLQNDNLDTFDYDSLPNDHLAGILFDDGMTIPDDED